MEMARRECWRKDLGSGLKAYKEGGWKDRVLRLVDRSHETWVEVERRLKLVVQKQR